MRTNIRRLRRASLAGALLVLAALPWPATRPASAANAATGRPKPVMADTGSVQVVADPHVDSLLVRALARMVGVIPGSDTLVDWKLFREHPQRTVGLVIPTLQPIKRDLYLGAPNMVWRVRVLQRLTGIEFRARTRAKLTAEERRALAPDTLANVRFAGESRDLGMTWSAPPDAQKAIIEKWARWWETDARKPALPIVAHDDDKSWWY